MDTRKKTRLNAQGWEVGSTREFLGLTSEEDADLAALLERRIAEIESGVVKAIRWEEFRAEIRRDQPG